MAFVKKYSYALYVFMLLIVFSCKKKNDDTGPQIVFETPAENQTFNVFDYVPVKAKVTDENSVASVYVNLLDIDHNPIHTSVPITTNASNSLSFNISYYLDNVHLLSGLYYIQIMASDGVNTSRKVRPIYIIETPKVLKNVFIVTQPNSLTTAILRLDTATSAFVSYKSFSGDFMSMESNSYYQFIYKCGSNSGSFSGIDATYDIEDFSIAANSSNFFTSFYATEKTNYIGYFYGNIRGYNYRGNVVYGANTVSGYFPLRIINNANYIVSVQMEFVTGNKLLVTYYPNGNIQQQLPLTQDATALFEKDATNVFVFGNNSSGQGVIQLFDRLNNNLWNPYPFSLASSIQSVVQITPTVYLLALSNGTIYKYDYQISSVTAYASGYNPIQMRYDEVNNRLYIVEGSALKVLNYSSASLMNTYLLSDPLKAVCLLYNR